MKDRKGLENSATARLKQARAHAVRVTEYVDNIKEFGFDGSRMDAMRKAAEAALQCVHEFSAYRNAIDTD